MSRNRLFRARTIVSAVIFLAGTSLGTSPSYSDDRAADAEHLQNLCIGRRDAVREAVALYRKTFTGDHFRYHLLLPWFDRLRQAELAACRSADERIAAFKALQEAALVDFLDVKHRFETGVHGGSVLDYTAAKSNWLAIQIGLYETLGEMESSAEFAELVPSADGDELISALKKYRLDLLNTRHRAAQAECEVGTVTIFELALAERQLFDATFAVYTDRQKRLEEFDKHIERLRRNEREQNHPHGRTLYLKYFQALRAEAQIERMRFVHEFSGSETTVESQERYDGFADERDSAIEWLVKGAIAEFDVGTLTVEEPFDIQNLARDIALSDAKTPADRIRVREEHLEACKRLEKEVATREFDRGKMRNFLFGKAERLTAEIDLLREQMRDQPVPAP